MAAVRPIAERFWEKASRPADGCWVWQYAINNTGYGIFSESTGKCVLSHRMAWKLTHGDIPSGLFVCHHCDNPKCVRPDHLFLGTCLDNSRDMVAKGRSYWRGGGGNPNAKLSESEVVEIRNEFKTARKYGFFITMARRYGVCRNSIRNVIYGDTWASHPEDKP